MGFLFQPQRRRRGSRDVEIGAAMVNSYRGRVKIASGQSF
jgi:hypothetical protein